MGIGGSVIFYFRNTNCIVTAVWGRGLAGCGIDDMKEDVQPGTEEAWVPLAHTYCLLRHRVSSTISCNPQKASALSTELFFLPLAGQRTLRPRVVPFLVIASDC
jgi:hypothetical protein